MWGRTDGVGILAGQRIGHYLWCMETAARAG